MGRKVRKQVMLTEEQAAALARRAKELGISEAELIRQGIHAVCTRLPAAPDAVDTGSVAVENMTPEHAARLRKLLKQIDDESRERLARRGGKLYPSSAEDIRRDREERSARWR